MSSNEADSNDSALNLDYASITQHFFGSGAAAFFSRSTLPGFIQVRQAFVSGEAEGSHASVYSQEETTGLSLSLSPLGLQCLVFAARAE